MSGEVPVTLVREGLLMLATVGGPVFAALMLIGFVIGIVQATTQINDPAVSFLPRAAGAVLVCWLMGGWIVERLSSFLAQAMQGMAAGP